MSRIGKQVISVPEGVTVKVEGDQVLVSGKLGELNLYLPKQLKINQAENIIIISRIDDSRTSRSLHGLYRILVNNLIIGVSQGFNKSLEFKGIGYRATTEGSVLTVSAGYSHPVILKIPEGLAVTVVKSIINVNGINKQMVGQFAAEVRSIRVPDAYKGKGIRYQGEYIRLKPGKTATKG